MTNVPGPTAILVDSPQDIAMGSAHLIGPTSPGPMSGISATTSLQDVPKPSEGGRPGAAMARTEDQSDKKSQEIQASLRRSESSELSSLLSQDGDFLTGRSSGSPSDHLEIKSKVKESQRRDFSSRALLIYRGGDTNDPEESLDDLEDSDSEFELEEDEDPVGREMRSSTSHPRPSRTMTDLPVKHARNAPLTRRASMPHGASRLRTKKHTSSKDLEERGRREQQGVIAQLGEKFDGGTVTKRGKGWIVIEESSDEEAPAVTNASDTASLSAGRPPSPSPRAGKKRKRKSSAPRANAPTPSPILDAQPPPAKKVARSTEKDAPYSGELKRLVLHRLSEALSEST